MKTYSQHLSGTGQTANIDIVQPILRLQRYSPFMINNKIDNNFYCWGIN